MAQTQTNAVHIIDLLNKLNDNPNEFELKLAVREAEKIKGQDPALSYMLLGMISAVGNSKRDCFRYFDAAALNSSHSVIGANRSKAYTRFCDFSTSFKFAIENYWNNEGDLDSLREALDASTRAGEIDAFYTLLPIWKKLFPNYADEYEEEQQVYDSLSPELRTEYKLLLSDVQKILIEHDSIGRYVYTKLSNNVVRVMFGLRADPQFVAEVNMAIADHMATKSHSHADKIIFVCRPCNTSFANANQTE